MRVPFEEMHSVFVRVLLEVGFEQERAILCAKLFAESSLDGIHSHGLNRFPAFIRYIEKGYIDIHAPPEPIEGAGAMERWDGNLGPGNLNAHFCMNQAIRLARVSGMGCVALRNTNHWMRGGTYGWQAAEANRIALCFTNTMPLMPPRGSSECRIGNKPLVIAVPREKGHIVLDMAMSQFSYGKLGVYQARGQRLPVPGGYDQDGELTTNSGDVLQAGRPLPVGYWKGSGLAIMLDLLAALLSAGRSVPEIGKLEAEHALSQVFLCFDVASATGAALGDRTADQIIDFVHDAAPVRDGEGVYYPGERTLLRRAENLENGIPVSESIWRQVVGMSV